MEMALSSDDQQNSDRPVFIQDLEERRKRFQEVMERQARRDAAAEEELVIEPGYGGIPPVTGKATDHGAKIPQGAKLHVLDQMLRRRDIMPGQWYAGVRFRSDYELARVTPAKPVSWERIEAMVMEPDTLRQKTGFGVKKGKVRIAWNDMQPLVLDAQTSLRACRESVSRVSYRLLELIAGRDMKIAEAARALNEPRPYISKRFREALDEAAEYYDENIKS